MLKYIVKPYNSSTIYVHYLRTKDEQKLHMYVRTLVILRKEIMCQIGKESTVKKSKTRPSKL